MEISIERLKRQCRVDFDDDNELLMELAEECLSEAVRRTGRTLEELKEIGCGKLPADFTGAVLMRVAERYARPEGSEKPNLSYESVIRSFQKI